jgi:hypothetical protein
MTQTEYALVKDTYIFTPPWRMPPSYERPA